MLDFLAKMEAQHTSRRTLLTRPLNVGIWPRLTPWPLVPAIESRSCSPTCRTRVLDEPSQSAIVADYMLGVVRR